MHQPNYNEFGTAVLQSVHTREGVDQLKECYENYANALLDALKSVDEELNLETLTLFNAQYRRFCAGLTISMLIGRSGGELLMKQLKEKGVLKDKIPEMIAAITYPETHTPLFESQSMLLQIAADFQMGKIDDPTLQHRLKGWVDDHGHVPVNFCDEPWTIVDAHVQLQQLLKKNCSDELKRLLESHGDRITRARQILNELQDESVSTLAHAVAVGTYLNEFRKTVFSKVSLGYRNFFKRIAQLGGSDDWRDCFYLTPAEMLEMVDGRKIELSGLVQERRVAGMYVSSRGTSVLLDKETTSLFLRIVESSRSYTDDENIGDTIEGFSANGGRVKGIARIIYSSRDFQKLLPGDILVTTMTSVDFVPIMERASAFVCNEGGITSHASIVAREMNKPCIIGTKIATKVLKDGDLVEVDATQGIVKIIQRA
jgi:phosphohistidine swiveling domain-containing protein